MGATINVCVEDKIQIDAVYSPDVSIRSTGEVNVDTCHGHINLHKIGGQACNVSGVNGSVNASVEADSDCGTSSAAPASAAASTRTIAKLVEKTEAAAEAVVPTASLTVAPAAG